MASVKGQRGGVRAGAGRKPRLMVGEAASGQPATVAHQQAPEQKQQTPLDFLLAVMNDPTETAVNRITAARAAAQYFHIPKKDGGKKDEIQERARETATSGRFATAAPPKLVSSR